MTYQEQIEQLIGGFPPRVMDKIKDAIGTYNSQGIVIKKDLMFSKRRFQATVTGTTTKTYQITSADSGTFFAYGLNDPLTAAGFPSSYGQATKADTSLAAKNSTNGNDVMVIQGIGFMPHPESDPFVAAKLMSESWVMAGTSIEGSPYNFGPSIFWPGGGGLAGAGQSRVVEANLRDTFAQIPGFVTNGMPLPLAYRDFGLDMILWGAKGKPDSELSVIYSFPRTLTWTMSDRAAAAGTVAAEVAPSSGEKGTYLDLYAVLFGWQIAARSSNR